MPSGASFGETMPERLALDLLARAPFSLLVTDLTQPDNPIVYANEAFETDTGYLRRDVYGKNCRFLQGKDTDPRAVSRACARRWSSDARSPSTS